jgi:uncharacterized membrane protein
MAQNVNPVPAVLFYLVYVAGIIVFATTPAFSTGKWATAAIFGALFGFFAYATYDLTNNATIKGWPAIITVADIVWGSLLTGIAAALGFLATRYFFPEDHAGIVRGAVSCQGRAVEAMRDEVGRSRQRDNA